MPEIDAQTLRERDDLPVIDVRTPGEYASGRAPQAVNVPLDQLQAHADRVAAELEGPVALVCASGQRAETARAALAEAGHHDAVVVKGGMGAWTAAGGEPIGERDLWSMERQVRFTAGSLVLAGVLGSLAWRPAVALSGFVGAGLTFSAVTNTCGLAMVLAKMPWNRSDAEEDIEAALSGLAARDPR